MRHLTFNTAGTTHHAQAGTALIDRSIALVTTLVPEPTNPVNTNAVQVHISGVWVGYVPDDICGTVSQLAHYGLIDSIDIESCGRLKRDPSIPWFRITISHYPLTPGKRDSAHMRDGFTTRIAGTRTSSELICLGRQINQCGRLREEDKVLLRRTYLEHSVWIKENNHESKNHQAAV